MQGLAGAAACGTVSAFGASAITRPPYAPRFFNAPQWDFLIAACDRLIPADVHGPGALALDVPRFIDMQMETPYGHGAGWYRTGPFVQGAANLATSCPMPRVTCTSVA